MVHIRECMRKWLPFVLMAAALGVSPAQDVASPDAAELDLDLVKLKKGPKGKQREATVSYTHLTLPTNSLV